MSKEQWLDAMSAPRIDPIKQAQKIMTSVPHWSNDSEFSSEDESADLHDYMHPAYEPPEGMVVPKQEIRVLIEKVAETVGQRGELFEVALRQIFQDTPEFSFMLEADEHYDYYESRVYAYWEGDWEQHGQEAETHEKELLQKTKEILDKVESRRAKKRQRDSEISDWDCLTTEEMAEYQDIKKSFASLKLPKPVAVNETHEQSIKKMQAIIKTYGELKRYDEARANQDGAMTDED